MNVQTSASFKKEFLAFYRTGKLVVITIVILGLAALSPLMITGLGDLMDSMSDIYDDYGIDISSMTGMLHSVASNGVQTSSANITQVGLIVYLLIINSAAGGEQKRRDVIIPRTAGLRSFSYLLPKYIIYPLTAFALAIIAMFVSWAVSSVAFEENDIGFTQVLLSGVLTGGCLMSYTCYHIALGTATGKAGVSAAVCITASFILPSIFMISGTDYLFNPFALDGLAATVLLDPHALDNGMGDIVVTVVFALALMALTFLIALFAQNAKRIDNTGNEMEL